MSSMPYESAPRILPDVPALDRSIVVSRPGEPEVRGAGGRQMRIKLPERMLETLVEVTEVSTNG